MKNESRLLLISFGLRVLFLYLGVLIDQYSVSLHYTDVDYSVFTQGGELVLQGRSPYEESGFRYSPFFAILAVPNAYYLPTAKWIFILADTYCVHLIHTIVSQISSSTDENQLLWLSASWGLNPLVVNICTRGSADSISNMLVLVSVLLLLRDKVELAGWTLGFVMHLRVYPIIYLPTFMFFTWSKSQSIRRVGTLLLCSCCSFLLWTILWYGVYGDDFMRSSLLYHLTRSDHRHNFSFRFYEIYLTRGDRDWHQISETTTELLASKLSGFAPQMITLLVLAHRFASKHLIPCMLLQTMCFVAMNKVVTAQYFTWYAILVPLSWPSFRGKHFFPVASIVMALWLLALGNWLYWAHALEFKGQNTFLEIWLSSVLFFLVNIATIVILILAL